MTHQLDCSRITNEELDLSLEHWRKTLRRERSIIAAAENRAAYALAMINNVKRIQYAKAVQEPAPKIC